MIKSFLAPAKINLLLYILSRRQDGYHNLYTIFQKITFYDRLEFWKARKFSLEVKGNVSVPQDHNNLCYKAWKIFKQKVGNAFPVRIVLYKNIPPGAGLGGGSSDAATVLKFLNSLLDQPLKLSSLKKIGQTLGADVPLFLSSFSTAQGTGIGEILHPWPTYKAWYLIVMPKLEISTSWAYKNLRLTIPKRAPNYDSAQPVWQQGLYNDFESLIFRVYPSLKEIKKYLLKLGAQAALLSGTGSSIFGVYTEEQKAQEARYILEKRGLNCVVVTNHPEQGEERCL